jgi:4'-phosphopantetheinyl transferase EntD
MRLIQRIRDALPARTAVAGGVVGLGSAFLLAEEEALAHLMSPKRRQEFAAGRHYAREALRTLGFSQVPIPIQLSRAPSWPRGVVGTISHSHGHCVAAVALRADIAAVGIDIESKDPLETDIIPLVCREGECKDRRFIESSIGVDVPKLVFVIKEAFYKAYYSIAGTFLEFTDVEVTLDPASMAFDARVVNSNRPAGSYAMGGRFGRAQEMLFAASWLTASEADGYTRHVA